MIYVRQFERKFAEDSGRRGHLVGAAVLDARRVPADGLAGAVQQLALLVAPLS